MSTKQKGKGGAGSGGASLKGFVAQYANLAHNLNSLAVRERGFRQSNPELGDPDVDTETMILENLALPALAADLPFTADATINKFAILVRKLLDACESGTISGDACRMADVVNAAICDVMAVGNNKAIQFEHGVGLVQALANHGLHSWIERSEPDDGQRDLNRLGKLLEGVFKVPEAKMAALGISPELRKIGIYACERLKQHLDRESHGCYHSGFKFKYIVVPRTSKGEKAASASTATPPESSGKGKATASASTATPSESSGKAGQAKRPLEFPDQGTTPSKPAKKVKKVAPAAPTPIAELSNFTHPAAAKVQAWIDALGDAIGDVKQLQRGKWQLRCTHGSSGRLRVLLVSGATNLFALNRTIAEAFGWGVGLFEHDVNKGTAPPFSGFLINPPGVKDGQALVSAKRRANAIGGTKGMAFLSEKAVKVCHVLRSRGDELTYKCGADTVGITLDGIDPEKRGRDPLPRCVGADASLGNQAMGLAGNWGWKRLNDSYRGDRKSESLVFCTSTTPNELAAIWMNYFRRPLFDNTGAKFDIGWDAPLPTMLEAVARPFVK